MEPYVSKVEVNITEWDEYVKELLSDDNQLLIFMVPVLIIIFVASVMGNLLTCIVIYSDSSMHTATNCYLFNLAVTDFLVSFGIMYEIVFIFNGLRSTYYSYDLSCKIVNYLIMVLWNCETLTITALAVERYVAVFHPFKLTSSSPRRVKKVIVIIWILALAESIPEIWTACMLRTEKTYVCFMIPTYTTRIINGVLAVVTFLIPLVIMAYTYTKIAFQVNLVHRNSLKGRTFNRPDNSQKISRLVIALTLAFLVCWVPYFSIRIYIVLWNTTSSVTINKWWIIWCKLFLFSSWCSLVLNPLLFSLMSTKFRQALKAFWIRRVRKLPDRKPGKPIFTISSNIL